MELTIIDEPDPAFPAVRLPPPRVRDGRPLMQVLHERRSERSFAPRDLDVQTLADLLWAANGINRAQSGHRTAPSARNAQEIDLYAVTRTGAYLFDPVAFELKPWVVGDLRAATGQQEYVGTAALELVYAADLSRMQQQSRDEQRFYSALDTGFISENVYLFCASAGLATVVRGMVDRRALAQTLKLGASQRIIAAQSVGFPA